MSEISKLREDVTSMRVTLDNLDSWVRTLAPRVRDVEFFQQRIKGFAFAFSLLGGFVGGLIAKYL